MSDNDDAGRRHALENIMIPDSAVENFLRSRGRALSVITALLVMIPLLAATRPASAAVQIRDVTFQTKDAGTVLFSHGIHMGHKNMANNCRACHYGIYNLRQKSRFTMADMERGKSCGACHGRSAFSLKQCSRCHQTKEIVYQVSATGATHFSHRKHQETTPACSTCHPSLFVAGPNRRATMADMEKGKSCGACHNGRISFPLKQCIRCHQVKEIVYRVKATGATHFSHRKHLEISPDCRGCHPRIFTIGPNRRATMADMEKGKSCGACHDGRNAFDVKSCTTCHPAQDVLFKVKETGPTHFPHATHIEAHHCSDCHTKLYPTTRRSKRVSMAEMEKGKSCGACHDGKNASPLTRCATCHPAKELVFQVKESGNVTFSHKNHTEIYKCGECHVTLFPTTRSTARVSMKEMEKGKSCGVCHDGKNAFSVAGECEKCHKM